MSQRDIKNEIAIIGGGLSGCLTALMLAKNFGYHVTLIEAGDTLLHGASAIASRLHLGGEYPLDETTALHCLRGAVMWKLLMPNAALNPNEADIYTPVPPMKFLVAEETQREGEEPQGEKKTLTLEKMSEAYETIRLAYKKIFHQVMKEKKWDKATTEKALFGSYEPGEFFRQLAPEEYADYKNIAGGIQTQELGLNTAKYLAMVQAELERLQAEGRVEILTQHKVKKRGIEGKLNNFTIKCQNGKEVRAGQVVQAAWSGGMELMPQEEAPVNRRRKNVEERLEQHVYRRAMLLVDLPDGCQVPPAFVMLGEHGGMFSPYNGKVAVCYLPVDEAAYINECRLSHEQPSLKPGWDTMTGGEIKQRAARYFSLLKERFPFLEKATNPRIVMRDTISFQKQLHERHPYFVQEHTSMNLGMGMYAELEQEQEMEILQHDEPTKRVKEFKKGLFSMCSPKGTYVVGDAATAAAMVNCRSKNPRAAAVLCPDMVQDILHDTQHNYSLGSLPETDAAFNEKFFREHPDIDPKINSQKTNPETSPLLPAPQVTDPNVFKGYEEVGVDKKVR